MLRFTPFNLLAAAFVIAAGLTHGNAQTVFWALALVTILAITLIGVETGFALAPAHFVERHGLVIIIVLGEAVIAAGAAAEARLDDAATLLALLVSLTLIAGLWWSYFDHDDTDAEEAFTAAPPADRARLAFRGYFLGHLVMIVGLVLASTGIHEAIGGVGAPALTHGVAAKHASAAAHALKLWHVPAGIALYLAGDALFRLVFTLPQAGIRFLFAILAMLMALFADISGILLLAAVTALVIVMLLIEHALKTSRARKSREEAPSATAHIE